MLKPFHIKKILAYSLEASHLNSLMQYAQVKFFSPFIRVVNYHDVPPSEAEQFEKQLCYYSRYYSPVSFDDLVNFHHVKWNKPKPGIILSFDDGFRSFREVVAPLLEKYGFIGWFFIPAGVIDIPLDDQHEKARTHRIFPKPFAYRDSRVFLTWDQILELDQRHIIGCHTFTHARLTATLSEEQLNQEIMMSKTKLEQKLHHEISSFAWVGGEEWSYSYKAADRIRKAGYTMAFMTNNSIIMPSTNLLLVNRTNIESHYPAFLMRFQLSGFMDIFYTLKRYRVNSRIRQD